jgi:hypothetical protein
MKRKIQILKNSAFQSHTFFQHLVKGTDYYQANNFERAAEEWAAAKWLNYDEPVELRRLDGRIFCGGYLSEIPFLFFLYAIFANRVSGVGAIKTNGVAKKLIFNNGRLVRAGTTRREERIGNYILKRGNFTSEKIGRYMVDRGLISEDVLHEILSFQVEEIISDIFFWQRGHFYFLEKSVIREAIVNYDPLNIARIAAQRGFNFKDFRNKIPNNKIIFRPSPYAEGKKEEILKGFNVNHQYIFSLIDGARNIEQLIKYSGADEVSIINILYHLSASGLIRKSKEVAEYEDKEFSEISKILEVLFEAYNIIYQYIYTELGIYVFDIIERSRLNLRNDHANFFLDVALHNPERLSINSILINMANHYPDSHRSALFIDAFADLFENVLTETERHLGTRLIAQTAERIRLESTNIMRFAQESDLKMRLLGVLNRISR